MNVFLRGTNLFDPYLLYNASIAHEKASRDRIYMANIARTTLLDIVRLVDKKAQNGEYILVWSLFAMDCIMFMSFDCAVSILMTVVHELERKGFRVSRIGNPLPAVLVIEWSEAGQVEYADAKGETYDNIYDFRERFRPINTKLLSQTGLPAKLDVYSAAQMLNGETGMPVTEKRRVTFNDTKKGTKPTRSKTPKKSSVPVLDI